jgi:RNA polymerase subunit RPABC4/transcription elongation factor Spt4
MTTESLQTCCEHCGALVFPETKKCPQCGKFPVRLHRCPRCKTISPPDSDHCADCGRAFMPGEDYL